MRILIIEDDSALAEAIADFLILQGADCDFAYSGISGLEMVKTYSFDLIILDLMLPRMNGFSVCRTLREQGYSLPVLMLTACDTDAEQLEGFQSGIDDYVAKPCSMPLLWARLKALHARSTSVSAKLEIGSLTLNLLAQRAEREGQPLKLTPTGWKILELLARNSPKVMTRQTIIDFAWGETLIDIGNFNVQIHLLRKVVDKPFATNLIHTQVGKGLCLEARDKS